MNLALSRLIDSTMFERALTILERKHILVIGKSERERQDFISQIVKAAGFETFRFPKKMTVLDDYLAFVRKENMYQPWYEKKGKFGTNQILDFHRDWISQNNVLIIMEEFDLMEERWRDDLLKTYIREVQNRKKDEKGIHLIVSQETENGVINMLMSDLERDENEKRTPEQIVLQNIAIFDISDSDM